MEWLGLSLLQASLLFGGLSAAVVAMYLGRRDLPTLQVPFLALWSAGEGSGTGSRLRRLRAPLSLLLALSILLLLVLALADPRPAGAPPRTLLFVLDCSASMSTLDGQPSRLADAKRALLRELSALRAQDHYLVLALAEQPTIVARRDADLETLKQALAALEPGQAAGDLRVAVEAALPLLAAARRPELVLLSDGRLLGVEAALRRLRATPQLVGRQLLFGKTERNLAIRQLAARSYRLDRTHQELVVSVQNSGAASEVFDLLIHAGETPLSRQQLRVPPHGTVTHTLSNLVQPGGLLGARIESSRPDLLPADDARQITLPPRRRTRVLAMSSGNRYLEAALLLEDYFDVTWATVDQPVAWHEYDVAVFDGILPPAPLSLPALLLAPYVSSPAQPLAPRGTSTRPFFESWDRDHPLLRGLGLGDVNLARAARTTPLPADRVLASAGGGLPLIVEGIRNDRRFVALTFDPRESDLPLRASFPLFVLASLDSLAPTLGTEVHAFTEDHDDGEVAPRRLLADALQAPPSSGLHALPPWQLLVMAAVLLLVIERVSLQRRLRT